MKAPLLFQGAMNPMEVRLPEKRPSLQQDGEVISMQLTPDFEPKRAVRSLLRRSRQGALATLMVGSGSPYCSLVNVASHPDGSPILLISRLAVHTQNLLADARVSLMLDERVEGDPLEGSRIMLRKWGPIAGSSAAAISMRTLPLKPLSTSRTSRSF